LIFVQKCFITVSMIKINIPHADARQHDVSHFNKPELTGDLTDNDPFKLFALWYEQALQTEPSDANAMSLATIDTDGMPNVRIVLLKDFSEEGFVFFTNYSSQKGIELTSNPNAAVCFHWKSSLRQIRIQGIVHKISGSESDTYFATRDRNSQIGAYVSKQSSPVTGRTELLTYLNDYTQKFSNHETIKRPDYWGGYCLEPLTIEFWQNGAFRLHDRLVFSRTDTTILQWQTKKLCP
jgi:pyridoxamine 5'-phosphate oxidase